MMLLNRLCDEIVTEVYNTDITRFILKTKYDTDKSNLEKKIIHAEKNFLILVVLLKTDYSVKTTEIEGKILSINGLVTNAALTAVENKITDVSSLIYNTKISDIE